MHRGTGCSSSSGGGSGTRGAHGLIFNVFGLLLNGLVRVYVKVVIHYAIIFFSGRLSSIRISGDVGCFHLCFRVTRGFFGSFFYVGGSGIHRILSFSSGFFNSVFCLLSSYVYSFFGFYRSFLHFIRSLFNGLFSFNGSILYGIFSLVSGILNRIFGFHSGVVHSGTGLFHWLLHGGLNVFDINVVVIGSGHNDIVIISVLHFLFCLIHGLFGVREQSAISGFISFLLYFIGSIINGLSHVSGSFVDSLTGVFQPLIDALSGIIQSLISLVDCFIGFFLNFVTGIV